MTLLPKTILIAVCLTVMPLSLVYGQVKKSDRYPNELPNYRFYESAKWKSLKPLVSTMSDVRKVLGEPSEANDVAAYTKPYPGDVKAKKPVFTYELDSDWRLLVYFVKYCFQGYEALPPIFNDTVCSLDLIPKKRQPFHKIVFPNVFTAKSVTAVDGAWTEYSDGTGLVYEVYTSPGHYSQLKVGDLNRIVYTATNDEFRQHSTEQ